MNLLNLTGNKIKIAFLILSCILVGRLKANNSEPQLPSMLQLLSFILVAKKIKTKLNWESIFNLDTKYPDWSTV